MVATPFAPCATAAAKTSANLLASFVSTVTNSMARAWAPARIAARPVSTSARAIFWNVPTRFLTGIGAAGGLAFINTIGVFGGFVGPSMMGWLKDWTGLKRTDFR